MKRIGAANGKALAMPRGLAMGLLVNMVMTLAGIIVISSMVYSGNLAWRDVGYGIIVVILVSAFLGAKAAYANIKHKKMLVCALSGIFYLFALLSITALFFGGQYEAVAETTGLVMTGSACAGLLDGQGRRGKRGKARRRYC